MKKNNKLIFLLLILFIPMFVKADMGAPISTYKVRISNPDGAETYEWDFENQKYKPTGNKLTYDTVYEVIYETIKKNEMYGELVKTTKDETGATSYSDFYTINLKDAKPLEVNLEDYKHEQKLKYYVFDDSCYLYKGPSLLYGKVKPEISLKVGTIIEVEYYDELWAYVEYNGQKGWVYQYTYGYNDMENAGMVNIYEGYEQNIITMKNVVMYKSPKTEEPLGVIIPKEVKLNVIYTYSTEPHLANYYVEYNGTKGWIKTITEKDIFTKEDIITNIAYEYENIYEIEVKNTNGINFYKEPNTELSNIGIIPYNTRLTVMQELGIGRNEGWYMVEYNGTKGWISVANYEDYNFITEENQNYQEELNNPIAPEPTTEEDDENIKSSINKKVIYYIGGAIIISLTSFVTILLINKKKKLKNATK